MSDEDVKWYLIVVLYWLYESHLVVSNSLQPHELYSPWNSLGQNTGVGSHSFLQGIFPTQELYPSRSPALQADSLPAELPGKSKICRAGTPAQVPSPGIKPGFPTLQADSLTAEPPGKRNNTGVGSLSLLQWIFLTRNRTRVSCIAGVFFTS